MLTADHATTPFAEGPAAVLLDALPDATAIVDGTGAILAVNRAWRMFTVDNGGSADAVGVGVNYLEVCTRSAMLGCTDAAEVASGLRAVLDGETVESDLEYPCPSPAVGRWFMLRITPLAGAGHGALVSHVNITRRKAAEQELEHKASHDPLTGLANRTLLVNRLAAALSPRSPRARPAHVGLLYIDLDGFKSVNDTYGHSAGDEVLLITAHRLRSLVRPQDTIGRLGGDEFVLTLPRITHDRLAGLAARTDAALAEPYAIHGAAVHIGASVGRHLAAPGDRVADALRRADQAMYAVKQARQRHQEPRSPGQGLTTPMLRTR